MGDIERIEEKRVDVGLPGEGDLEGRAEAGGGKQEEAAGQHAYSG